MKLSRIASTLTAAVTAALVGCADPDPTPPTPPQAGEQCFPEQESSAMTMSTAPSEGIAVIAKPSGGHAAPRAIGGLAVVAKTKRKSEVARPHDRRGRAKNRGIADLGSYGIGIGGFGTGGAGMGYGAGKSVGRMQAGAAGGESSTERGRWDLDKSPWAYAEIQLPHRPGSTPGKFPSRSDASINPTVDVQRDMFSTFGADVDTAAYSIARRSIRAGRMPERSIVRVEEFINYFRYDYEPPPAGEGLFSIEADGARSPFAKDGETHLLRIGLQATVVADEDRKPANLVFLVDTSCSMTPEDRLPLVKKSLEILVDHLGQKDSVAITTYAGGVSLVLPPTQGDQKQTIRDAIHSLNNGGGTAMASGLHLAYMQAVQMLRDGAITRIIVCSDGDANIGATTSEEMLKDLRSYISEGVTLSAIGYGDDNFRDQTMEQLADKGNGNYFYVDSEAQAKRVFARDLTKMIQDVAQDVKIQVEFDARAVRSYRLIGYENRDIADEDFRNDRVDAGEIGAGHQVTALYALELDPSAQGRLGTVRVRAKQPRGMTAKETELSLTTGLIDRPFARSPSDFRFAVAVAGAADVLRGSARGAWTMDHVIEVAKSAGSNADPDRIEFIRLMEGVRSMMPRLASADH